MDRGESTEPAGLSPIGTGGKGSAGPGRGEGDRRGYGSFDTWSRVTSTPNVPFGRFTPVKGGMVSVYVCEECGYNTPEWLGRCPNCGEYGSIEQERSAPSDTKASSGSGRNVAKPRKLSGIDARRQPRQSTGLSELDRVLGGGLVPGSVVLLGGPPGIGKSTLLLQWGGRWEAEGGPVLYLNGEESGSQIARRARRIGSTTDRVELVSETTVEAITHSLDELQPSLVFVDSIQTVTSEDSGGMPGSMAQLRAVTQALVRAAKQHTVPFVLIGHVTKQGEIGGPKRLEHMVDTVLYFDDAQRGHRFLRSAKNRYGPTGELGIFEMSESGLEPIDDPGQYFCRTRDGQSGCMLTVALEGTRPLLVEVQSLVTPSQYGTPQRSATGLPHKRLLMHLAVLEKKMELPLGTQDVFVNVAGGLRLDDPGADLAVAMAIASSFRDVKLPPRTLGIGELGLTGQLRSPGQIETRLKEVKRLNSRNVLLAGTDDGSVDVEGVTRVNSVSEAADFLVS